MDRTSQEFCLLSSFFFLSLIASNAPTSKENSTLHSIIQKENMRKTKKGLGHVRCMPKDKWTYIVVGTGSRLKGQYELENEMK